MMQTLIGSSCFRPRPRVDSAVIEIVLSRNFHLAEDGLWSALLHRAFARLRHIERIGAQRVSVAQPVRGLPSLIK